MNTRTACVIACTVLASAFTLCAGAAEVEKPQSQQSRFAACAHESKGLRGDAHQDFMSECLKGREEQAAQLRKDAPQRTASETPFQQGKMKICNDEAGRKNLHGDERRAFMSSCLKG
ncbi:MAG TPA: PsiF family protein [Usitatibacter sp.]